MQRRLMLGRRALTAMRVAATVTTCLCACSSRSAVTRASDEPPVAPCLPGHCTLTDAQVRVLAEQFMTDAAFRRTALEESLLATHNTYAQERLRDYAQPDGWDALPLFDPPSAPLYVDDQGKLAAASYAAEFDSNDGRPSATWTLQEWIDLGRRAFHAYPAQQSSLLAHALELEEAVAPGLVRQLGLWQTRDSLGGLMSTRYQDGSVGTTLTCATCHARTNEAGRLVDGLPSNIDLTAYDPALTWGPGRVDVTADAVDNPVAIADLRATRVQERLHYSGNLANSLAGLAVRIETLLITNHHSAVRPPREVAFGLSVYVWHLGEELVRTSVGRSAAATTHTAGERLFAQRCATCHRGEWGEGGWVSVEAVGTEPLVARSTARGTGGYRVPTLLGFEARRLSHEARDEPLEIWLNGGNGTGARGHAQSTLSSPFNTSELATLTEFLRAAF